MKAIFQVSLVFFILFNSFSVDSQPLPDGVCKVENGQLSFTIDLRWTENQKQELIAQFELDSAMIAALFSGQRSFEIDGEKWEAKTLDHNYLLLYKSVQKNSFFSSIFLKILTNSIEKSGSNRPGYVNGPVNFGVNKFRTKTVFYKNNRIQFRLYGHQDAEFVLLSGSFNDWSTSSTQMKKSDGYWETEVELSEGKYYYKFIVDGQWISDPENLNTEPDGHGGENSVYYVVNYVFNLPGFNDAERVVLVGSFNNWNETDAEMLKTETGWALPAYIGVGKHYYKYIVDGEWILDPDNSHVEQNEFGTGNSVFAIGEPYYFVLKGYSAAKNVFLAGSFNNWKGDELSMLKTDSGWVTPYYFAPGNYEYKYVVDGKWMPDPNNPLQNGSGDFINSFFTFKPNYTFVLESYTNAKSVIVTGSFNNWIQHGYQMEKTKTGWKLDLFLPPGKTSYRFIIDGQWIHDPANQNYEKNEFDSYNSILWIK
ncbi:MAG: glycogen-binding domain-containing protein [Bacteroidales bacterium]|nr:glycogen-binding domain-containing protein [Bacteroidales bacterium]